MIIRKLPNISVVIPNASIKRPWKVERRQNRREHISVSPRLLASRESFEVVLVGRYESQRQADNAAMRSAVRYGGFAKSASGWVWPERPIKPKTEKRHTDKKA